MVCPIMEWVNLCSAMLGGLRESIGAVWEIQRRSVQEMFSVPQKGHVASAWKQFLKVLVFSGKLSSESKCKYLAVHGSGGFIVFAASGSSTLREYSQCSVACCSQRALPQRPSAPRRAHSRVIRRSLLWWCSRGRRESRAGRFRRRRGPRFRHGRKQM